MNLLIIQVCLVLVENSIGAKNVVPFVNIAYYELPPYIYKDDNGSMSGIFPELFAELSIFCHVNFRYSLNTKSPENFSNFIENKTLMEQYQTEWLWLSLTQNVSKVFEELKTNQKVVTTGILTTSVDVIVHRDLVGPLAKIRIGIFECRYLFLIAIALSIIFGTLIWFIERWTNSEFSKNFHGILTGLWFGLVTMTTVGYGDIAPKSSIGKLLTVAWMMIGVVLTAILTSTITTIFGDMDYLKFGEIWVVDKTFEESTILSQYKSTGVKTVGSYDLLFERLLKNDHSVGVVDSFVRKNRQSSLDNFRLFKVYSDVPVQWMYRFSAYNYGLFRLDDCIYHKKFLKVSRAIPRYRLENELPDIEISMMEFFSEPSMFTISILAVLFIAFGLMFEAIMFVNRYKLKSPDSANHNKQSSKTHIDFRGSNKSSQVDVHQLAIMDYLKMLDDKINTLGEKMSSIEATLELSNNENS